MRPNPLEQVCHKVRSHKTPMSDCLRFSVSPTTSEDQPINQVIVIIAHKGSKFFQIFLAPVLEISEATGAKAMGA